MELFSVKNENSYYLGRLDTHFSKTDNIWSLGLVAMGGDFC